MNLNLAKIRNLFWDLQIWVYKINDKLKYSLTEYH